MLAHDPKAKTILSVDVSPSGLDAVLAQRQAAGEKKGTCAACTALRTSPHRAPPAPRPYPAAPWECVHLDTSQINNDIYLVVVGAYAKWLECFKLKGAASTTAVLERLSESMARFGPLHTLSNG
ncbi:hypothetical protein EVAR_81697_1 [Eumeta japonica]|uniref:Integrase catalytic domain-containing protein n=1 Tax=Eumeta variegata TaxID=151549 RepID=A0A4C1V3U8_EUMVA|nr:hypothetical protein EVAR_81697_1 [Eumeta japonica]